LDTAEGNSPASTLAVLSQIRQIFKGSSELVSPERQKLNETLSDPEGLLIKTIEKCEKLIEDNYESLKQDIGQTISQDTEEASDENV